MTTCNSTPMRELSGTRFGELNYAPEDVLAFPWGLPGFGHLRAFLALSLAEQPNFLWLQSVEDAAVALPVATPWPIFPQYDPKLPVYAIESLEIERAEDFTLLCVAVVTPGAAQMTMNLLAPIVVNLRTRRGRQITLEGSGYSVREPVPRTGAKVQKD